MTERNVWFIDDDQFQNKVNSLTLKRVCPNCLTTTYSNSAEALSLLKENNNAHPDLIFLDLDMPILSGIEFLEALHEIELNSKILILSASKNEEALEKAQQYEYVAALVRKPLRPDDLRSLDLF